MIATEWKRKIEQAANEAGTYKPIFDAVIDTLSQIMEKRDDAQTEFEAGGKQIIVEHTNKGGATNYEQNPLIRLINDLNRDALAYWRDLGLTPAGLRKINEASMRGDGKESALEKALRSIGEEKGNEKLGASFAVRREHPKRGKDRVSRAKASC